MTENAFTVRAGTIADARTLTDFAWRVFVATFGAANNPDDLAVYLAEAFGETQQAVELADPSRVVLLMEHAETLVAYAMLRVGIADPLVTGARPIEIQRFYVDHPWHGRRVAERLMACCIESARAREADVIWLGVWEHNPRAIRFYGKQGFVDVGSHPFLVGTDWQTDRVMMRGLEHGDL